VVLADAPATIDAGMPEPEGGGIDEGAGGEYESPQAIAKPNSSAKSVIRKFIS